MDLKPVLSVAAAGCFTGQSPSPGPCAPGLPLPCIPSGVPRSAIPRRDAPVPSGRLKFRVRANAAGPELCWGCTICMGSGPGCMHGPAHCLEEEAGVVLVDRPPGLMSDLLSLGCPPLSMWSQGSHCPPLGRQAGPPQSRRNGETARDSGVASLSGGPEGGAQP